VVQRQVELHNQLTSQPIGQFEMVKQTNRRNKQSKVGKLAKKVGKTRQTVARRVLTAGHSGQNGQAYNAGQVTRQSAGPSCDLIFKIISQHANGKNGDPAFKKLAQHYYNRVKPVSGRAEQCQDIALEMYWTVDLMKKQIIADSPVYRRFFESIYPPGEYDMQGRKITYVDSNMRAIAMPAMPAMPARKLHQIKPQML
jgi:hypothetical protein